MLRKLVFPAVTALLACACDTTPEPVSSAPASVSTASSSATPEPSAKPKIGPGEIAWIAVVSSQPR